MSEADFIARPRYTDPEILRASLANVVLRMLSLGLGDIAKFPFLERPDERAINEGVSQLVELGAIGEARHELTPLGRDMAKIPIDAKLARMLIAAQQHGALGQPAGHHVIHHPQGIGFAQSPQRRVGREQSRGAGQQAVMRGFIGSRARIHGRTGQINMCLNVKSAGAGQGLSFLN